LTPLLEDERYNGLLVLGGDLNTLCTARPETTRFARDQGVLCRITRGFRLVDLLQKTIDEETPPRGRLQNCRCNLGSACRHTWTYRKRKSSVAAYQDDYLFASSALAERRVNCHAIDFTDDSPSDHVPIVAVFDG